MNNHHPVHDIAQAVDAHNQASGDVRHQCPGIGVRMGYHE
jgi:hypothetical protein